MSVHSLTSNGTRLSQRRKSITYVDRLSKMPKLRQFKQKERKSNKNKDALQKRKEKPKKLRELQLD